MRAGWPTALLLAGLPEGIRMKDMLLPLRIIAAMLGCMTLSAGAAGAAPVGQGWAPGQQDGAVAIPCERGFVFSKSNQVCLKIGSERFAQGELYEQGEALARAGQYEKALEALGAIESPRDARVLTMSGYAKRKLGRFEEGIKDYLDALELDPDNADAREYLGEAYFEAGRPDLARAELNRIETICGGRDCEQYRDLAAAIDGQAQ